MQTREGIVTVPVAHAVDETVEILVKAIQERGIKLFCVIDHSGEAAAAGVAMPPTKLLVFGNPKAGTPVMLAAPTSALDLPLKLLVWQDGSGQTLLSYNSAEYLGERHAIPEELTKNIGAAAVLAATVSSEAPGTL